MLPTAKAVADADVGSVDMTQKNSTTEDTESTELGVATKLIFLCALCVLCG